MPIKVCFTQFLNIFFTNYKYCLNKLNLVFFNYGYNITENFNVGISYRMAKFKKIALKYWGNYEL